MPKTTRTFVAIVIPEDRAAKLGKLQTAIATEVIGVRWVEPKLMHATLAFLGDVIDTDLDRVCRAVAGAAAEFEPIELRLEGLGAFPRPQRPHSIWVGLTGPGLGALTDLAKIVAKALGEVGYAPSSKDRFSPHVTLGRVKKFEKDAAENLTALVTQHQSWVAGSFTVSDVVTYASTTTPQGPIYTPLARAALEGRKPQSRA